MTITKYITQHRAQTGSQTRTHTHRQMHSHTHTSAQAGTRRNTHIPSSGLDTDAASQQMIPRDMFLLK